MDTLPPNIINILNDLDKLRTNVQENKKSADLLCTQFNTIDKKISKYLKKEITAIMKKREKEKEKKPKGFAMPTTVSETLCLFMEQPINTKISRTSATKFLMDYIKTNNLIDPNNKKVIIPDNRLWELIGDDARHEEPLDRFNIQKYLNHHFLSSAQICA
jgi:upstream activation factor subunit UAF30